MAREHKDSYRVRIPINSYGAEDYYLHVYFETDKKLRANVSRKNFTLFYEQATAQIIANGFGGYVEVVKET